MSSRKKTNSVDYWIVATISILSTIIFLLLPFKPKKFGDANDYHDAAKVLVAIVQNKVDASELYISKGLITILYYFFPYLLSEQIGTDEANYYFAISWNLIFNTISLLLIFSVLKREFGKWFGYLGIGLLLLFPIHIYYAVGVGAETAAFCVTALILYVWHTWKNSNFDPNNYSILTLALLLTILFGIRINTILAFPLLGLISVYYFFYTRTHKEAIFLFQKSLQLFLLSSVLAGTLYFLTNTIDQRKGANKSDLFYYSITQGRYEFRADTFNWLHWTEKDDSIDKINQWKKNAELKRECQANPEESCFKIFVAWSLQDIWNNKLLTIKQYLIKFFQSQTFVITSMFLSGTASLKTWLVHIYFNIINLSLVLCSLAYFYQKRKSILLNWPLWLIWLAFYGFICIFHSEPRYLFPLRPFLIYMTIAVLYNFSQREWVRQSLDQLVKA